MFKKIFSVIVTHKTVRIDIYSILGIFTEIYNLKLEECEIFLRTIIRKKIQPVPRYIYVKYI